MIRNEYGELPECAPVVPIFPKREQYLSGGKVFERCPKCGQLVRVNKFLFGSLHTCVEAIDD